VKFTDGAVVQTEYWVLPGQRQTSFSPFGARR
jgi:hypothetical protein